MMIGVHFSKIHHLSGSEFLKRYSMLQKCEFEIYVYVCFRSFTCIILRQHAYVYE